MPKFSVLVPIFEVEKYIRECIDSILSQSFSDFELILVDDGSTDNCPAICDEYAKKDNRIRVIHKKNGGLVSARKVAANAAIGEYVVCIDSDDWIEKNHLKTINDILIKNSVDVVCFGSYRAYSNNLLTEPFPYREGFYDKEQIKNEIVPSLLENKNGKTFSSNIWSKAYRRELYVELQNKVGDSIKIGEDHALTKPVIFHANSLYISHKCLYYYRQNNESMTKEKKPFSLEVPGLIAKHFEANMDMSYGDLKEQVYRHAVHYFFISCISQFNEKRSFLKTRKLILEAIKDPFYSKAIRECRYSILHIKGQVALILLKGKFCFLMKICNKIYSK